MNEIFAKEFESLEQRKSILTQDLVDHEVLLKNYTELLDEHFDLIKQAIMLTKVSDRLQSKVDKANYNLNLANENLKSTIEQLDKMKIGRRATIIVFIAFIAFYIFTEGVIEPIIENWASNTDIDTFSAVVVTPVFNNWIGSNAFAFYLSMSIKLIVAILFKPLEDFVSHRMEEQRKKEIMKSGAL